MESPALLQALREHVAGMELEGQLNDWSAEQRQLVFPNTVGRITHYGQFLENVRQPVVSKAGLPYRKHHATRHTYATWLLSDGPTCSGSSDRRATRRLVRQPTPTGMSSRSVRSQQAAELDRYLSI
jgi:integrase